MAFSLLRDLMGRDVKLQFAMSDCPDDTGCIEAIAS